MLEMFGRRISNGGRGKRQVRWAESVDEGELDIRNYLLKVGGSGGRFI